MHSVWMFSLSASHNDMSNPSNHSRLDSHRSFGALASEMEREKETRPYAYPSLLSKAPMRWLPLADVCSYPYYLCLRIASASPLMSHHLPTFSAFPRLLPCGEKWLIEVIEPVCKMKMGISNSPFALKVVSCAVCPLCKIPTKYRSSHMNKCNSYDHLQCYQEKKMRR